MIKLGKRLGQTSQCKRGVKAIEELLDLVQLEWHAEERKSGYQVTIYDRYDNWVDFYCLNTHFKLEKFVLERRTKLLKESSIKFIQNF